jgi:Bacterial membrane protein YfhO
MFKSNIFLCSVLVVSALVFFGQNLFDPEYFTAGIDIHLSHYWNKLYISERLAEGGLPLWSPYNYAGHPFTANPENHVFYPPDLLYHVFPLELAFDLNIVLHAIFTGLGVLALGQALGLGALGRLAAALIFMFSGYMVDRIGAGHLMYTQSAAYLPWLIFCVERLVQTGRVNWSIGFALFFSLSILGGTPQNCYYLALASGIYFVMRTAFQPNRANWIPLCLSFIFGLLLTVLLTSVQVFPTLELMTQSDRSETSYEFVTYLSFPFKNFLTLLLPGYKPSPYAFWEYTIYCGMLALGLALLGSLNFRKQHSVIALIVLALFSITCMLGEYTPIYRLYYHLVPGIDMFRIPARSGILLVFCIAIFAGFGAQFLANKAKSSRYAWALLLVPLVLYADLYINFQPRIPQYATSEIWKLGPHDRRLFNKLDAESIDRIGIGRVFANTRALGLKHYDVNGYTPLAIGHFFRLVHELADVSVSEFSRPAIDPEVFDKPHPFLFRLLNMKYSMNTAGRIFKAPPSKRAFLVEQAIIVPDSEEALRRLKTRRLDIEREVILEKPGSFSNAGPSLSAGQGPGTYDADITEYSAHKVVIEVRTENPGYLVMSEVFYPGWQAAVNGVDTEILRANYAFRAIALDAGSHRIEMLYKPVSVRVGGLISLTTLGILLVWAVVVATRRRFYPVKSLGN